MSSGTIETGLSSEAHNIHRALASLQEELEAIDNYHQRVDVSDDESLKEVLAHNRDDEMEHATMLLEWLRRAMPGFDLQMRKFLFSTGSLTALAAGKATTPARRTGLGLGSLQGKENKEQS
jgi:ferritin-like protein